MKEKNDVNWEAFGFIGSNIFVRNFLYEIE